MEMEVELRQPTACVEVVCMKFESVSGITSVIIDVETTCMGGGSAGGRSAKRAMAPVLLTLPILIVEACDGAIDA